MSTTDDTEPTVEPTTDTDLEPGQWARDREADADDDDVILVVDVLEDAACTHVIYEEPDGTKHTVASHRSNRGTYDPRARVVMGVYKDSIDYRCVSEERAPAWSVGDVLEWYAAAQLDEYRLTAYPFPADRLAKYGE